MAKSRASDVVAAAASEITPQAVVVKDFQPVEAFYTDRPCLTAVEKDSSDLSLIDAAFRLERYLPPGLQCGFQPPEGASRQANPSADFVLVLTCCSERGAQILEGLNLFHENATKSDVVLSPGARLC